MKHLSTARRSAAVALAARLALALLFALLPLAPAGEARQGRRPARANTTSTPNASEQTRRAERAETFQRPRLVLLIVVDQFRYDYLERFGDLFAAGGLRRLQQEGASWVEANYDHIPTETAPGHATLMTGAWPSETGIIANEWYDRDAKKRVNNVQDDTAKLFDGVEGERASSPRNLLASTVATSCASPRTTLEVVGISVKDRGAILPAGRMATPPTGTARGRGASSRPTTTSTRCHSG